MVCKELTVVPKNMMVLVVCTVYTFYQILWTGCVNLLYNVLGDLCIHTFILALTLIISEKFVNFF